MFGGRMNNKAFLVHDEEHDAWLVVALIGDAWTIVAATDSSELARDIKEAWIDGNYREFDALRVEAMYG